MKKESVLVSAIGVFAVAVLGSAIWGIVWFDQHGPKTSSLPPSAALPMSLEYMCTACDHEGRFIAFVPADINQEDGGWSLVSSGNKLPIWKRIRIATTSELPRETGWFMGGIDVQGDFLVGGVICTKDGKLIAGDKDKSFLLGTGSDGAPAWFRIEQDWQWVGASDKPWLTGEARTFPEMRAR